MLQRETEMTAYELLLSESQERMLLVVHPENVAPIKKVFDKWDITCREVGQVIAESESNILDGVTNLHLRARAGTSAYGAGW